jgi:hypothetical protein
MGTRPVAPIAAVTRSNPEVYSGHRVALYFTAIFLGKSKALQEAAMETKKIKIHAMNL